MMETVVLRHIFEETEKIFNESSKQQHFLTEILQQFKVFTVNLD